MISDIRIVHVSPETNRVGEIFPHPLVFPDRFLTFTDKRIQPVLLNLFLAVQPQKPLHFQFNRQSVGIPSRLTGNHTALHGAVSGDHVLDHAGQYMPDMRLAVGRRRAVIEGVCLTFLAGIHALFENVIVLPKLADFLLPVYEIQTCVNFLIHDVLLSCSFYISFLASSADCSANIKNKKPRPVKGRGHKARKTTYYDVPPFPFQILLFGPAYRLYNFRTLRRFSKANQTQWLYGSR